MSELVISHGQDSIPVDGAAELEQQLGFIADQAEADATPVYVNITTADQRRTLTIGLGASTYSALIWYDDDTAERLTSKGTIQAPDNAGFLCPEGWTPIHHDAAIPEADARQAARELAEHGHRPALAWKRPEYGHPQRLDPADPRFI
ncbi:hypothetical protein LZ318_35160 [Saccharopolyspora indica]|uniref:Imm1 family immunity protein n=1 Tax=Saccharopolyspora indica TaxID=1229659 RepID=UPI0022EA63DC|nr:Imm1 family immunity protein [Saccharopolyspora indica]MDA3649826.1 Imm1 family immunity protein [Saccharopolyspora indica]